TMAALRQRGSAFGQELSADVPGLRTQILVGDQTKKWAGPIAVTTLVVSLLAADGRIVRGRPRGSWISSQYRWVPRSDWLPEGIPEPPVELARAELARRWLAAFGPAPAADLQWWTGWTAGETKRALALLQPVEVDLDGRPGLVLPDDRAPSPRPGPWAALLPALDPTVMGWAEREWFLGDREQRALLFDRSGNAGPTVWWDGQVVGGWAQRRDGDIAMRLLRDVGTDARVAIEGAGERLRQSVGAVRITPRFRTPIERELTA
ncbi:MAG: winged helix DNA-binding domain-containing protein, partial [Actinomycetota bacterium]|nr:winged helix DNA-binding domain-containing protein [Actinomycetota bacterium]